MRHKLSALILAAACALLAPSALHAQLTTLYSQGNGQNSTQFSGTQTNCVTGAQGIDNSGNGVCTATNALNLAAQTSALTSTVLCSATSCPAGQYQVTIYTVATTAATVGTIAVNLGYTDDAKAQSVAMITGLSLVTKAAGSATYTFYTTGTAPVTLSTVLTAVTGSPAYSVHASVRPIA